MQNILCEKPKYILNPAFKQAVLQTGKFVYNGDEEFVPEMRLAAWRWSFPYARFSPKGIDFENLACWQDSYYTTDRDGDIVPMFLAIPCRKCALCRKRNAREWMFRAVAETQHSRTVPYFITLTYNNLHRPSDGVNKEDVQKFLKRLRQILARDHNFTEEIRYFAAAIYKDFFSLLVRADNAPDSILFTDSLKPVLDLLIQGVVNMYRRFNTWKEPVLSRDKEIAREFVQLVWQYYTKERSASFYAGKLRITLPHFCYVIKKTTGMTALDIIANVVIMDAKAQLKSTNLPIKEISIGLGYSNVAFFDKYFRRYVGMSPLEYRNS